jgi:AcrR family transcriptional regulator
MARPLSDAAHRKMLRATQEIAVAHGLEGFSIDEVARRSGVAKSTIYRHFGTGDELLLAAMGELVGEVPDADTGSLLGDLTLIMTQFVAIATQPSIRRLFTSVLNRAIDNEDFAALQEELVTERKAPMRRALQRGMARGEIDPAIDLELASTIVQGPFVARVLQERGSFRHGEVEQIVELMVKALAP